MTILYFDKNDESQNVIRELVSEGKIKNCRFFANENVSNAITQAQNSDAVVAFIDTRLHGKRQNGFSIAAAIREQLPKSHIVFMSSYQEDMVFCLKNLIRPSAFLLKPLSRSEILSLFNSIDEEIRRKKSCDVFSVSTHEYRRSFEVGKIVYFSTFGKKLILKTSDGEKVEFYGTIRELEDKFDGRFIRCHSGFLVNKTFIKGIRKGEIELFGFDELIPISKKYKITVLNDVN